MFEGGANAIIAIPSVEDEEAFQVAIDETKSMFYCVVVVVVVGCAPYTPLSILHVRYNWPHLHSGMSESQRMAGLAP